MYKYRKAFVRNDGERYSQFLARVAKGEAKLHADTLALYEIVGPFLDEHAYTANSRSFMRHIFEEEKIALNAT